MTESYAGDVSALEAWQLLSEQETAVLVDCRTAAEWAYVGVPDLGALRKPLLRAAWQLYPGMERNPAFEDELASEGASPGATVVFICRSGARSKAAAIAMTAAGFSRCLNLAGGFEGPADEDGHRGRIDGWKAAGLPWVQE